MTSKQSSWCCCFSGRPPEITRLAADPIQPIQIDIPMPDDENEIDTKFSEIVAELDVDQAHRDALFNLPSDKKWQLYCSKIQDREMPDAYIDNINSLSDTRVSFDDFKEDQGLEIVDGLKTALRTQPMSFVTRFLDKEGLECLLNFLKRMDFTTMESSIHTSVIGCIKALMNNSQGRAHVFAFPDSVNIIAQSLSTENIKTKTALYEILGAMCLVPGGHKKVLEAMLHYQKYAAERTRFQSLIFDLERSTGRYREEVNLKTAIMSFINAALKYGPGQESLEFRLHLRYEFLMLGIQPVIDKLRNHGNATLDRHLDYFEMMRNADEKQLCSRFENVHVDTKSAYSMFDVLRKKLTMSSAYQNFMSIMQHLILLPFGNDMNIVGLWKVIDQIVQQVVLQQKNGKDPDVGTVEMNVKNIVRQMTSETDLQSLQQKLKDLSKQNEEMESKLAKKDHECEIKNEEKAELAATVTRMVAKLDSQTDLKQVIDKLNMEIEMLKAQLAAKPTDSRISDMVINSCSIPDDAKVGISTSAADAYYKSLAPAPPPPMAPPPPPAPGAPPPPPAPGMMSGMGQSSNHPKPKKPMKSLNWDKLPDMVVSGTVWNRLQHEKVYPKLDLNDFEKTFSAYQKKIEGEEQSSKASKHKELALIDGRRAQNCTILLSKLKLTNEEVIKAVTDMDSREDLPKDMLEQLLKFVPTTEEIQTLNEHSQEVDNMARADRFLFEASQVFHYEAILKALYFKKKFPERLGDIRPKINAVIDSSNTMMKSTKLRQLLEIILALGNFMNRGQRGNAKGFKLNSLNNMLDTKSSMDRNVTLLHYLVDVLEKRFPKIMPLESELPDVKVASKVNMGELDKEIVVLRSGLSEIEKEILLFEKQSMHGKVRFVSVMTDFVAVASYNVSEIEEAYTEMINKFKEAAKSFGDISDDSKPDDFFGIMDTFINSINDAKQENERIRQLKEEEERRAKLEEQMRREREKSRMKKGENSNGKAGSAKGEFDELISALRTGDVFGEDLSKMRRNRKRAVTPQRENSRERAGAMKTARAILTEQ
ncbi:disheveled-associated activator of morphogenesis 1-A-like [Mytilus galloprovincialis]|uniref:disheveled-associated activator of morphogenesis 1-A-like n=1 Tax=Mytilus galloprovincialis TaxID=29158 RepID=UPI003F7C791B